MELSLSTHLLVYRPLEDSVLAAISAAGYRNIEVWLAEPHVPWRNEKAIDGFRARLESHGLRAASAHLPFYPSVPDLLQRKARWSVIDPELEARRAAIEGAAEGLRATAALGAACGVLHLGWQRDAWCEDAHIWAREAVAELLPVAHEHGIQLLLENIISAGTRCSSLTSLLDEVDPTQSAGICLDLGHAHVDGGVLEELEHALPRLAHLHVHDNDGVADHHWAPGQGTIPWEQVLQQLDAGKFEGFGALELRDTSRGKEPALEVLRLELDKTLEFQSKYLNKEVAE